MNSCTASGLAPESIRSEAKVWRHSWSVIGFSSASVQTSFARLSVTGGENGDDAVRPEHKIRVPATDAQQVLVQVVAQDRQPGHGAATRL
jgi:hypothetical protein